MRKLQVTLVLLAIGLFLSVALLALRALEGVAFEKAARHQAVASRVFDEMERALSRLLEREEARPFESYASPEALGSDEFVLGYFQIDPDGSLHTASDALKPLVAPIARRDNKEAGKDREATQQSPAPGVTQRRLPEAKRFEPLLERRELAQEGSAQSDAAAGAALEEEANAYQVLESLNRGSTLRAARQKKITTVAKAPPPARAPSSSAARDYRGSSRAAADSYLADAASVPRAEPEAQKLRAETGLSTRGGRLDVDSIESEDEAMELAVSDRQLQPAAPQRVAGLEAPAEAALAPAPSKNELDDGRAELDGAIEAVRVALEPMVGRPSGSDHLLLYRTVLVGEQGYRQGLVIERSRLGQWLESRVLTSSSRLAEAARFSLLGEEQAARSDAAADSIVYEHRFGEPFDAFSAVLALTPLPGGAGTGTIYALIALVVAIASLGLFAVYRMVAVTVQYAERRSNFVSAVSHELKTPLTAIRMYGEMLRDGLTDSESKRQTYYQTITDESERLSRLINNVLEFSRIERGNGEVSLSAGAIAPVLEEAAQTLRPHAERAGFALRVEVDPDLPAVRFDRDCVVQLLFNLVDNAMKYANAATHKEIVISCRREGDRVALCVRDFGPGVARQHLGKVFEPFYRGESEMTRSTRGTGIGLALVKDLAERMEAAASGANAQGGGFQVKIEFQPAA